MSTATLNERTRRLNLSDPGIAMIAAAVLLLPLWAPWQAILKARPHYEFYPILVFGMIFLVRHRLLTMEEGSLVPGRPAIAGLLGLISLPCLFFGYVVGNSTIMSIATVLTFSMVLYATGGWGLWRRVIPVFFLLMLMTPPPGGLDLALTLKLQQFSVAVASRVLDLFGIFHVVNTNTLEVDGQRFLVEEACSGIQSMFSILAFALFYSIWNERGLIRTFFMLAGALVFDISLNVIRICLGVVAKITGDINLLDGWPHEILGIVVFVLGLLLTLSWDVVLDELRASRILPTEWLARKLRIKLPQLKSSKRGRKLASDGKSSSRDSRTIPTGPFVAASPLKKTSLVVLAIWAIMVLPMTALSAFQLPRYLGTANANPDDPVFQALEARGDDRLKKLDELTRKSRNTFDPPRSIGDWTLLPEGTKSTERTMSFGSRSESFLYSKGNSVVQVSIDYPFQGFHDLNICYDFGGWRVAEIPAEALGSTPEFPFNVSTMSRGIDQKAVMVYSAFLDDGQWRLYKPAEFLRTDMKLGGQSGLLRIAGDRLSNRISMVLRGLPDLTREAFFTRPDSNQTQNYTNYQIQALLIDTDSITNEKQQTIVDFFRDAAPLLKAEFLRSKAASGGQEAPPATKSE
ncbi:exosortase U [bacterium]|nr:exosortase U [bacterium]